MKLSIKLAIYFYCFNSIVFCSPLDDYVNLPDPVYNYSLIKTFTLATHKIYVLNMTSQKWLNETVVNKPVWWHFIYITVPNKLTRKDVALIWLGDGSRKNDVSNPDHHDVMLTSNFSLATETVAVLIQQIPFQPLKFMNDPSQKKRSEDALIAWGWKKFIDNTSNSDFLLRLPMTKAAVKCMDTVEDFMKKNYFLNLKKFMIAGKSKRGWTTWTTAAVDSRVFAAIPIVMDMLNINTALHQNYKSVGGWTFAFKDYHDVNITSYIDSREIFEMQKIIDPFYYLDRYKYTNILVISTTGDEFFFPDNTFTYWDNLVAATDGKVLHRRIPNIGHTISSVSDTILSSLQGFFFSTYYHSYPRPKLRWTRPNNSTHGILKATVELMSNLVRPMSVRCWYGKTDQFSRDFRQAILTSTGVSYRPITWKSTEQGIIVEEMPGEIKYSIAFQRPSDGWLGFFFEVTFSGLHGTLNKFTTETNIVPEWFPNEDCSKLSCFGNLV